MATPAVAPILDDRFLILETLGRGGMASVYRAFDRVGQRFVALKVQLESEPVGPPHPFAAEFDAWSRVSHPNVVGALELLRARSGPLGRDTPYLVLEHVAGGPAHRMLRPGRETPKSVQAFAIDVMRGLGHVHRAGFVHRDLKPSNVLVGSGPATRRSIKLTDFGLATPMGQSDEPGRISGSLPYVAPEVLCGQPLDQRADLYGLGILVYLLVCGKMPLPGAGPDELVRWHLTGPPLDPLSAGPRCPRRLARFIRRLTARNRDARPADATRALALLDPRFDATRAARGEPACSRADRTRIRLALDAVRLGAVRVLSGAAVDAGWRVAWREAQISAQVLGLGYHEIAGRPPPSADLDTVTLQLLAQRGPDPGATLRHFGLEPFVRLAFVGGLPVLDRTRTLKRVSSGSTNRDAGLALARFFLDCAERQALVLGLERAARATDPRVAALCRELRRVAATGDRPRPRRGGLLLLID